MRKYISLILTAFVCVMAVAFTSCGEYQKALKSSDANYKFDFAKRALDRKSVV